MQSLCILHYCMLYDMNEKCSYHSYISNKSVSCMSKRETDFNIQLIPIKIHVCMILLIVRVRDYSVSIIINRFDVFFTLNHTSRPNDWMNGKIQSEYSTCSSHFFFKILFHSFYLNEGKCSVHCLKNNNNHYRLFPE
jgi:hypothetical protein